MDEKGEVEYNMWEEAGRWMGSESCCGGVGGEQERVSA